MLVTIFLFKLIFPFLWICCKFGGLEKKFNYLNNSSFYFHQIFPHSFYLNVKVVCLICGKGWGNDYKLALFVFSCRASLWQLSYLMPYIVIYKVLSEILVLICGNWTKKEIWFSESDQGILPYYCWLIQRYSFLISIPMAAT